MEAKKNEKSMPQKSGGAQGRNRTTDTRIFSPLLYQLSYLGSGAKMTDGLIEEIGSAVQRRRDDPRPPPLPSRRGDKRARPCPCNLPTAMWPFKQFP